MRISRLNYAILGGVVALTLCLVGCKCKTTIKFVPCPGGEGAMAEQSAPYDVEKGSEVCFVNTSGAPITLDFLACDLFEGDPAQISLGDGEKTKLTVKESATGGVECRTLLTPDCAQGGPVMIPYP